VGRLGSAPRLVGRIGSGVRVSASFQMFALRIITHAFITRAHSVVVLNQRRRQSLGGQHGKGVDGLFEKVSFQRAFEGVTSG